MVITGLTRNQLYLVKGTVGSNPTVSAKAVRTAQESCKGNFAALFHKGRRWGTSLSFARQKRRRRSHCERFRVQADRIYGRG